MSINPVSLKSFDSNHELYDKVRFGYKREASDVLIEQLGLTKGSNVLELAAGTGKFTRNIADKGFNLTASEPSEGMAQSFKKNFPEISIVTAGVYDLPFDDETFDGAIAAQAFHWFADHKALAEISRVLKPGAKLGLIWNYEDIYDNDNNKNTELQRKVAEYFWKYDHGVPQYRRGDWRKAFENQQYFETPLGEKHFKYEKEVPADKEYFWNLWASRSYITALNDEEKEKCRQGAFALIDKYAPPNAKSIIAKVGIHIVWAKKLIK